MNKWTQFEEAYPFTINFFKHQSLIANAMLVNIFDEC